MPTSTQSTTRAAAPAVIENYERERVFSLFRQWGYLEAELNPLGLLPPQPHPDLEGKMPISLPEHLSRKK